MTSFHFGGMSRHFCALTFGSLAEMAELICAVFKWNKSKTKTKN
jgi:hypothetical protein